jgi:phage shock protein PspC (stress-responsive transcriptional regulator)
MTVMDFFYLFLMAVAGFFIWCRLHPGAVDPQIFRSREDRMFGGVLGGLGRRFGIAPLWPRLAILAVVLVFPPLLYTLAGLYVVLWAITPREPPPLSTIPPLEERLKGTGVQPHQVRASFEDPTRPY